MAMMKIKITPYLSLALLCSLTSPLFSASIAATAGGGGDHSQMIDAADAPPPQKCNCGLTCEIEDMKFKLSKLELLVEMTDHELYTKGVYILKCEKKIDELSQTIHQLESNLSNAVEAPDYEQEINVFEEKVQELEAVVRSNERELRYMKLRSKDSENRVDALAAQAKTTSVIIPELWFHVQKLEQAQEVIERRTAELRRHIRNQRCFFFKFINNFGGGRYQVMVAPYTSKALHLLKRLLSAFRKYHHQLQGVVKREMHKHELTAVLAGEESVFLLASITFVFPVMLAWIWLSTHWR